MMIHKITPSVDYHDWLKRLDTKLYEPTNKNSIKLPKENATLELWGLVYVPFLPDIN